ncbi:bifunctional adenosylcobinamide kinase/adenosylcobinamide-phosphate guanylyltransferase [Prochlorothrix hollandica]|uniref:Adenosylcobinamide kinase n=1 Tax=Prochlorothrix hollandica PCC 9006 = CALU 1027 TaxID=317619 RepID=A0A0M2PVT0_PROHO|nr:bifunctional adenosylcobinamide kinase/adenosylcobinamide-phosphate guanylyltransferase [Prochlorothrix hollandica]KKI99202.1 adenosylcobinamide kinase [Prochlorothrix hollandica PCC 9006 = CALU 1027]
MIAPAPCPTLTLITGPARSGKSEWAEHLAHQAAQTGLQITYVATAQRDPQDAAWCQRLEQHRQRRPPTWRTLEVPQDLATVLQAATGQDCLLIDSLGTWVANHLDHTPSQWQSLATDLGHQLRLTQGACIVVGEETGWGVVPPTAIGGLFRDRLGGLIRSLGGLAQRVYLVAGGHALDLRQWGEPLP